MIRDPAAFWPKFAFRLRQASRLVLLLSDMSPSMQYHLEMSMSASCREFRGTEQNLAVLLFAPALSKRVCHHVQDRLQDPCVLELDCWLGT